ncbi:MAG TPA: ribonuclease Z [Rhodothermales bacterium]
MQIIPLGTASAIPTRHRHLSSIALMHEGDVLLFDCGEGTQMRLIHAGVRPLRIVAIFITHFHGDHFYGLLGLLATMALLKRTAPLTVVGPTGIEDLVTRFPGLSPSWLPYNVQYVELPETFDQAVVFRHTEFDVEARPLDHREFTAGFRLTERPRPGKLDVERARTLGLTDPTQYRHLKQGRSVRAGGREVQPEEVLGPPQSGRSFGYVTDTRPCDGARLLARNVDLLYHEATFGLDMASRAAETGHSTAAEAATIARDAGASRLLIGHFSARYSDPQPLVEEARRIFPETEAAEELKSYSIG